MSFPSFFTFAVCHFQREEACSRVRQQREYFFLKTFHSFCYNYQPVLRPSGFIVFLPKLTGLLSVFTQKGRKKCEKGRCLVVNFAKAANCFMKKALKSHSAGI